METVAFKTDRQGNASSFRGIVPAIKIMSMSYVGRHENVLGFFGAYTAEITQGKQLLIIAMIGLLTSVSEFDAKLTNMKN
jgi:hypothetical protein